MKMMYIDKNIDMVLGSLILGILLISIPTTVLLQQLTTIATTPPGSVRDVSTAIASLEIIRNMLSRSLSLNISSELKQDIEKFLIDTSNISSLSMDKVNMFIDKGKELLKRVGEEVYSIYRYEVEQRYTTHLRLALENRIKQMARLYNISEQYLANILAAKNVKELAKALSELNRLIAPIRYKEFGEIIVKIHVNAIERGTTKDVKGLEKAYEELSKVMNILNKTIERLKKTNASQIAIKNLEEAIEKVSIVRELIRNTSEIISKEHVIDVRKAFNRSIDEMRAKAKETIEELHSELIELRERAMETNITSLVNRIDQLLQRLENISKSLVARNISIEMILSSLAKIKLEIKEMEKSVEKGVEEVPVRDVERAFNVSLTRAEKLMSEINKTMEFIRNVCTQIYPLPIACNKTYINMVLKLAENNVIIAKNLINKARKLFDEGKKVEALITIGRANAILSRTKAWLEPLYNMLRIKMTPVPENITKTSSVSENVIKLCKDIEKRYNETVEKFNELSSKLQNYRGSNKTTLASMLNDIKVRLEEAYNFINKAKEYIAKGYQDKALESIAEASAILNDVAMKLEKIEKIIG